MLAWTFSARTLDEVASLLRSMGRHRYVREADHALHWSVDEALSDLAPFAPRAARFRERRRREPDLDPASRDPSLWSYADTELVIEALGRGNVPPETVPAIGEAIAAGLPVVITSRCMRGRVLDTYGYPGGGRELRNAGCLFGGSLSGQKARIRLMLALAASARPANVADYFQGL